MMTLAILVMVVMAHDETNVMMLMVSEVILMQCSMARVQCSVSCPG